MFKYAPLVLGYQKGTECGRRAASSRVPANPDNGDKEGRGLTDTRSMRRVDRSEVTRF